ncbi:unnamed protein product [Adineta steineri]|uniref:Major facilitator superfamily (MFS) profile domain-containing protein n=1 Tax=Adineta steineri TaxID=433720 RepID=A0A814TSF1_9BILA|nr:unnamed protein product [Adineta steineri]CAF1379708.1 unnamed protein product [Adineta steineri]
MEMSSPVVTVDRNDCNYKEKRILIRKLDLHILPLLSITYFLSCLDRANIANAKLAGLERDVHLTPEQYRWSLSIFFIGFAIFELPSNIILRRWKPSKWIALIVFLWGIVAVSTAAVRNASTLLLCRFLLGLFEAGYFPGLVYYTSLWYERKEQAFRLGFFLSFATLAGASNGLLAFAILQIKSTYFSQWQLIFIIEGIPTLILALICWFCLPDSPEQARFLTDKQRQLQIARITQDAGASLHHSFSWSQVISIFTDWKTYVYAIISICGNINQAGVTLFLPSRIHSMGVWTPLQTQLLTIPPYIAAFVSILVICRSSDYFIERSIHLVFANLLTISGLLIMLFVDEQHVNILYMSLILVMCGSYADAGMKIAWFNNNFASLTRRAVASAVIVSLAQFGSAIGGQIFNEKEKRKYFLGNRIALSVVILQTILILILRFIFAFINRQRSRMNIEEINQQIQRYGGKELAGDHHPEFRYTL